MNEERLDHFVWPLSYPCHRRRHLRLACQIGQWQTIFLVLFGKYTIFQTGKGEKKLKESIGVMNKRAPQHSGDWR